MKILFALPYQEVKTLCHNIKNYPQISEEDDKQLKEWLDKFCETLNKYYEKREKGKFILIPIPQKTGYAEYTQNLAFRIAEEALMQFPELTFITANCISGIPHDSVCERKQQGLMFDDIDFGFSCSSKMYERIHNMVDDGWHPVLVDNVIDTGTTARAAIKALGFEEDNVSILTIGDTKAWKYFN